MGKLTCFPECLGILIVSYGLEIISAFSFTPLRPIALSTRTRTDKPSELAVRVARAFYWSRS
jgi:hypothetical protein